MHLGLGERSALDDNERSAEKWTHEIVVGSLGALPAGVWLADCLRECSLDCLAEGSWETREEFDKSRKGSERRSAVRSFGFTRDLPGRSSAALCQNLTTSRCRTARHVACALMLSTSPTWPSCSIDTPPLLFGIALLTRNTALPANMQAGLHLQISEPLISYRLHKQGLRA